MYPEPFSLKRLEEFIGREAILKDVHGWLEDGKFHLAFFSGEYGIGKTRLLERILDLARKELKYDGAPLRLIDLYHFRQHSPEGLAIAIFECFKGTENEHYFNPFITARRRLEAARAAGDSKAIREHLQALLDGCADGVKKMSAEHGILLLFDTTEQFVYPTGARFAPAWDWLKGWLGNLPKGAVLFAGRPAASALFQQFPLSTIPLGFFTQDESCAYILRVGENWTKEGNREPFRLDEKEIPTLHGLSQGRPILLAIFLELRMRSDPQEFRDLSTLGTKEFEEKIINYLLSEPELGETLKAAGRTRKGMSAELLARTRGGPLKDAKAVLETLKERVFAKSFPDDEHVFLHDELYALLEQHVYADPADAADRQAAAQAIIEDYRDEIGKKNEELKNMFASLTAEKAEQSILSSEDYVPKIGELETKRQQLKTEFVHYRLRYQVEKEGKRKAYEDDPVFAGLKMYYRYGHEAATSNNDEILIPLQIELTNFWLSLADGDFWMPFIEGLLFIHEIWLKIATGQNYWEDVPKFEENLGGITSLSTDQKAILHALLQIWLGTGLVFGKPEYDRAQEVFTKVIEETEKASVDERLEWFKNAALSLAYRQRAYLRRIRGLFEDAIEDFRQGLYYSRFIHFDHEEATLRNDMGYAQMLAGGFQSAFENMWDGLKLRYKLAVGPRIALSHSSLAQHFIARGAYEEARKHAQFAVRIAGAMGYRRGIGFGNLALAEAARRFAFSAQGPSNQADYLREAEDAIKIALENLDENARMIEANLEQACLYRDRVRIETDLAKRKEWFKIADKQFQGVAHAAEKAKIEYRQADAMCNRIWLGYYADDTDHAEQAAKDFELLEILKPYWLKDGKFVDEAQARKNPQLWSQIGKYFVGRGVVSLAKWKEKKKEEYFKDAARFMMLGVTYSAAFAEDHRGLREGRRTLLLELAKLDADELKRFGQYVLKAEKTEKIVKGKERSALQVLIRDHALWFAE